jgi:autophagy-related protein 2
MKKITGTTMLESMWSSMSSSMQLAQECLEKNEDAEFEIPSNSNLEGLEKFAQTIDNSKFTTQFAHIVAIYK